MAGNPFAGIITPELKQLHKFMIDAILEDTALTVPCTLIYNATKYTECSNCIINNITGKSSGKYKTGGPIAFTNGQCPYCNGVGKVKVESTDTIYLLSIWDSKKWIIPSELATKVADIAVQTMSKMTTYPQITRCSQLQIDTKIENFGIPRFERMCNPQPLGWGDDNWIITTWKRA